MLCRSFFSGTMRFSRRYSASTGAGTPCGSYSPVPRSKPGISSVSLFGSVMAKPGGTPWKPCHTSLPDMAQ